MQIHFPLFNIYFFFILNTLVFFCNLLLTYQTVFDKAFEAFITNDLIYKRDCNSFLYEWQPPVSFPSILTQTVTFQIM